MLPVSVYIGKQHFFKINKYWNLLNKLEKTVPQQNKD